MEDINTINLRLANGLKELETALADPSVGSGTPRALTLLQGIEKYKAKMKALGEQSVTDETTQWSGNVYHYAHVVISDNIA